MFIGSIVMGFLSSALGAIGGIMANPMLAAGALGGAQSAASYIGQKKTNEMQQGAAREQMAFQERMSSSAYQRAMDDMRKAGLNPILAGKLGGASSPGGAMPIFHSELGAGVQGMQSGIQSGMDIGRGSADISLKKSQESVNKLDAQIKDLGLNEKKTKSDIWSIGAQITKGVREDASHLIDAGLKSAREVAEKLNTTVDEVLDYADAFFSGKVREAAEKHEISYKGGN